MLRIERCCFLQVFSAIGHAKKINIDAEAAAIILKCMLQYQIDELFHALAAPGRRAMVERLARGAATLSELAEPMDMTLTAVTQHLRILEASGWVHSFKQGRTRHCRLRIGAMDQVTKWIDGRKALLESRLDRLGELLEEDEAAEKKRRR
jgi:DNA-binding transcriptional ArsR family regulator